MTTTTQPVTIDALQAQRRAAEGERRATEAFLEGAGSAGDLTTIAEALAKRDALLVRLAALNRQLATAQTAEQRARDDAAAARRRAAILRSEVEHGEMLLTGLRAHLAKAEHDLATARAAVEAHERRLAGMRERLAEAETAAGGR